MDDTRPYPSEKITHDSAARILAQLLYIEVVGSMKAVRNVFDVATRVPSGPDQGVLAVSLT